MGKRTALWIALATLALVGTASAEIAHPAVGGVAGYAFDGKQHVFYRDGADRLCQLFWNGTRWSFNDLTSSPVVKAPPISGTPSIVSTGGSMHVFYRTKFNKMAELYRTVTPGAATVPGPFKHSDVTKLANVDANVATDPVAWVLGNSVHVAYIGTDNVVHELYWNGSEWRHSAIAGHVLPDATRFRVIRVQPAAAVLNGEQYLFWIQGTVADAPTVGTDVVYSKWTSSDGWRSAALVARDAIDPRRVVIGNDSQRLTNADVLGFTGVAVVSDGKGIRPAVAVKLRTEPNPWWIGGSLPSTGWYWIARDDLPGMPTIVQWKGMFPGPYTKDGKIHLAQAGLGMPYPMAAAGVNDPPKSRPTLWTLADSLHVAYPTADGHIHELTLDTSWRHRDLTQLASAN